MKIQKNNYEKYSLWEIIEKFKKNENCIVWRIWKKSQYSRTIKKYNRFYEIETTEKYETIKNPEKKLENLKRLKIPINDKNTKLIIKHPV